MLQNKRLVSVRVVGVRIQTDLNCGAFVAAEPCDVQGRVRRGMKRYVAGGGCELERRSRVDRDQSRAEVVLGQ